MDEQANRSTPNALMPAASQATAGTDYATRYKKLLAEVAPSDRDEVLASLPESISDEARYHIVGKHGGAWIYDVDSNEELERLLALAPVYNFARYDIYPLAEMETPADVLREQE